MTTFDVLVVGAGPTGTALAIDLIRRGLDVRIVNKADRTFPGSRAKGVQPRTLEVFADLGVIDEVLNAGSEYPLLGVHLGPVRFPWRMMTHRDPSPDVPYPNTWLIPQYRTDAILRARLQSLGGTIEFGRELTGLVQDADAVTATVTGPDGRAETITARYLVGADGGPSAVRRLLGIGFAGSTDEADRMVIADTVVTGLSRDRWHVWPRFGGRFVGACPLPDGDLFQWMIRLAPGEDPPLDEAALNERIAAATRDPGIRVSDVRWTSVFRPNIRLAERYRDGRVFLAGDAAHVHTPAGAQGLNTGVQDAYNLGWKLGQVLAGADPSLLDTYETERLPIAAGVLGLSTKKYAALSRLDPSSVRRGKDEQQLALTYRDGPLASGDRTTTLRPGDRAPDAPLSGGATVHALLRGPQFTVIACGPRAARALSLLGRPATGARLRRVVVEAAGDEADHALTDPGGTFQDLYGLTGDALLLVRPDGYLAHIATGDLVGSTRTAIRTLTPHAEV